MTETERLRKAKRQCHWYAKWIRVRRPVYLCAIDKRNEFAYEGPYIHVPLIREMNSRTKVRIFMCHWYAKWIRVRRPVYLCAIDTRNEFAYGICKFHFGAIPNHRPKKVLAFPKANVKNVLARPPSPGPSVCFGIYLEHSLKLGSMGMSVWKMVK